MARHICVHCGIYIVKSGFSDPYLCRDCERVLDGAEEKEKYTYLDNY